MPDSGRCTKNYFAKILFAGLKERCFDIKDAEKILDVMAPKIRELYLAYLKVRYWYFIKDWKCSNERSRLLYLLDCKEEMSMWWDGMCDENCEVHNLFYEEYMPESLVDLYGYVKKYKKLELKKLTYEKLKQEKEQLIYRILGRPAWGQETKIREIGEEIGLLKWHSDSSDYDGENSKILADFKKRIGKLYDDTIKKNSRNIKKSQKLNHQTRYSELHKLIVYHLLTYISTTDNFINMGKNR